MYKLLIVCLLLSPLTAELSMAQAGAIDIICSDCRDPDKYPDDYVNFAFNQIYGPDAWLSLDQADDMFISNLDQQRVYVDADFVFIGIGLLGIELPIWPVNLLQFTLALPSGRIFTALRSIYQTSLPVPATSDIETDQPDRGDFGGSGDEEDEEDFDAGFDEDPDDWEEPEEDDFVGFVEIEDPDEYGDFEEPEWCEEC